MTSPWRISEQAAAERDDALVAEFMAIRARLNIEARHPREAAILLLRHGYSERALEAVATILERRLAAGKSHA